MSDFPFGALMFLFGLIVGGFLADRVSDAYWHRVILERGQAEYNSKTGAWQWKGEPEK